MGNGLLNGLLSGGLGGGGGGGGAAGWWVRVLTTLKPSSTGDNVSLVEDGGFGNLKANEAEYVTANEDSVVRVLDKNGVVKSKISSVGDSNIAERFGIGNEIPDSMLDVQEDGDIKKYTTITGTISVTNGSKNIVGSLTPVATKFTTELTRFQVIDIEGVRYVVDRIKDDRNIRLFSDYAGSTDSGLVVQKSPDFLAKIRNENGQIVDAINAYGQSLQGYEGVVVANSSADFSLNDSGDAYVYSNSNKRYEQGNIATLILDKPLDIGSATNIINNFRQVGFINCDCMFVGSIANGISFRGTTWISLDGAQDIFAITMTEEFAFLNIDSCLFLDAKSFGVIKGDSSSTNKGVVTIGPNVAFIGDTFNYSSGLKFDRLESFTVSGSVKFLGGNGGPKNIIEILGGVNAVAIDQVSFTLSSANEYAIRIAPDVEIRDDIKISNNAVNIPANFFATDSLNEKSNKIIVRNNSDVQDNTTSGKVYVDVDNTTATTFAVVNSWAKILATYKSRAGSRFVLGTTNGFLKYNHNTPDNLSVESSANTYNASASSATDTLKQGYLLENPVEELLFNNSKNLIYTKSRFVPANDDKVRLRLFDGGVVPTGLSNDTIYYVVNRNIITEQSGFTYDYVNNKILLASHGFVNNDRVAFRTPGNVIARPLIEDSPYWVINAASGEFQLSLTQGGAAINIEDPNCPSTGTNIVYDYDTYKSFQLSLTQGGAAVTFSTDGTDVVAMQEIINEITFDTVNDKVLDSGHSFVGGELVMFRGINATFPTTTTPVAGSINDFRAYYVKNPVAGVSYQLEYTPTSTTISIDGSPSGTFYRVELKLIEDEDPLDGTNNVKKQIITDSFPDVSSGYEFGTFMKTTSTPTVSVTAKRQYILMRD